ncbi:TetR/AcrR family transcriptional regulator [Rhodococcus erythropolis]|uniref:TetR/AcrR family transcriptional regulator n=1 Tax=Rhodococcus baikonurensis TaxID=172041 RepID=A0ABV5X749_9NOCA|nr:MULTISPECIES: TetR/AcrR family transcriptional regulator [Rhodococcus]NHP16716.1 TetR/AcrR family transcriptional regulator [Rhodococcus sp. IC4_135]MBJ7479673.1 TetR family transcriptional regulator [Rhodococcus sp. (in: high G+C Gram-positive bacteria)]MBT2269720.1 TetR family transcriptional regulator [Rhodococcus erythropolis]QQM25133.1 TetR family transcriptional regulator [Rhodococcus sp. P-2]RQO41315.1 TetR/AcrR family transcriptional regulator [Rhodococcus sp. KBW08]
MVYESTRRRLTGKQAETVARLAEATVKVLREQEFSGLTVRSVAAEAGVGTATAYTYFASKEHLVAEVFWRRLQNSSAPDGSGLDRTAHVLSVLRNIALLLADEPEVSAAVTNALLGSDPEVEHLRGRIGLEIHQRLASALDPDGEPEVLEALEMLYAGALLRAGIGYGTYAQIAGRLEASALLILEKS